MQMQTPKHDLNLVKELCEKCLKGFSGIVEFNAPSRSINCVIEVLACETASEAKEVCLRGIMQLEKGDYSHSLVQWETIADVYGLQDYRDNDWYIKFVVHDDDGKWTLEEVSFHRPEKDLKLADGRILPGRGGGK